MKSLTEEQIRGMLRKAYSQGVEDLRLAPSAEDNNIPENYAEKVLECADKMFSEMINNC